MKCSIGCFFIFTILFLFFCNWGLDGASKTKLLLQFGGPFDDFLWRSRSLSNTHLSIGRSLLKPLRCELVLRRPHVTVIRSFFVTIIIFDSYALRRFFILKHNKVLASFEYLVSFIKRKRNLVVVRLEILKGQVLLNQSFKLTIKVNVQKIK